MRVTRTHLLFCFSIFPIVLHFYLLNRTIINFPSWGDDFLFFELIDHAHKDSWFDFIKFLFKPHNQIHLLVFGKVFTLFAYWIFGSLQFKYIILFANLFLLGGISYLLFKYLKSQLNAPWHFFAIMCILFAPSASIDNYQLIGVLQHTGSLSFLTFIAYTTVTQRHHIALLVAVALYPFVSTEGWAMLPLLALYMLLTKHPLKYLLLLMSLIGIIVFGYLLSQYPQPKEANGILHVILQAPMALLAFLGNSAWPISDTYKIPINAMWGFILLFLSLYFIRKNDRWELPTIIWLQVLATGTMISVGRSQGHEISTLILSERFYSYASFAFIATYLLLIPQINKSKLTRNMAIVICTLYLGGSFYYHTKRQTQVQSRLRADLTNVYNSASITSYPASAQQLEAFMNNPYYKINPQELLNLKLENPKKTQILHAQIDIKRKGEIVLKLDKLPEKKSESDQRWLAIQSMTNPDSVFIVPFFSDKVQKPKIFHINSLLLTDIKKKNLWLFTEHRNGETQTEYLGTIK
jgi:hypothetical protein